MKKNQSKILAIVLFILFGVSSLTLLAQDKENEFKSKIEQIKGKVEKVIVNVDGKEVVFEGKDAEKAAKGIQAFSKSPHVMFLSGEEDWSDEEGGHVSMFKFDDDDFNWKNKNGMEKKIEVCVEDGKKKVTVTANEDGEEKTKVYEGEEAEKFLQENKKEGKFDIYIDEDENGGIKSKMLLFHDGDDDEGCSCCHHKMKMRMPQHGKGIKKIIIEEVEKDLKEKKSESEER
ncbi:MAG: hypothetical protein AB1521_04615 [Bacteroidota bacterium]